MGGDTLRTSGSFKFLACRYKHLLLTRRVLSSGNIVNSYECLSCCLGDEVWVSDPDGTFNSSKMADANLVLLAAGSGKWYTITFV